jgi:hypothetical protein
MGIDRPHGDGHPGDSPDASAEMQEPRRPQLSRDYSYQPLTEREIERQNQVHRGELRWNGQDWGESEPYDHVQRHDRAERMTREVELPASARDLPGTRDILPNLNWAELDHRKFSEYSLNPDHPHNGGKAEGWRALGYDVDSSQARHEAAQDLRGIIRDELLVCGKVAETRDTPFGPMHKILNGFIGPNGRHATLVTCWLVEDQGDRGFPKLTTAWVQLHRDKETER